MTSEGSAVLSPTNRRLGIITWSFPMRLSPRTGNTLCRTSRNVNPGMDIIIDKQDIFRRQFVCSVFVLVPGNDSPCLTQDGGYGYLSFLAVTLDDSSALCLSDIFRKSSRSNETVFNHADMWLACHKREYPHCCAVMLLDASFVS